MLNAALGKNKVFVRLFSHDAQELYKTLSMMPGQGQALISPGVNDCRLHPPGLTRSQVHL